MTMKLNSKLWITVMIACVVVWFLFYLIYDYHKEYESLAIDQYNFSQLEKIKLLLDTKNTVTSFNTLQEFNTKYNVDIKPVRNCYYASSSNWKEKYIFWFKLYSRDSMNKYWVDYYVYPRYDIPYDKICYWVCDDRNKLNFEYVISHPCE